MGRRSKRGFEVSTVQTGQRMAQSLFQSGRYLEACDLYELLYVRFPGQAVELLAELYDLFQSLPQGVSRYELYQARLFDFQLKPSDRVLDIGSGNDPFPLATHLADIALEDNAFGRAGVPFKRLADKRVHTCALEDMSCFRDKEFDFVYCSHVLEHVWDPSRACAELMRIGKRGFIETPTRGKDLWLCTAAASNHRWAVENVHGRLVFSEYDPHEVQGLQCDLLLRMHTAPESRREKALTSLMYLKADLINTMLMWEDTFECEVRPSKAMKHFPHGARPANGTRNQQEDSCHNMDSGRGSPAKSPGTQSLIPPSAPWSPAKHTASLNPPTKVCAFINTYYEAFLAQHYAAHHGLPTVSYGEQLASLQAACFGDSDFYSYGLAKAGWQAIDLVVNCQPLQEVWAREHGIDKGLPLMAIAVEQIRRMRPQVLYLQDLGIGTSDFFSAVRPYVDLIVGQIASPIPPRAHLDGFDILISSFPHFVDEFRRQGRLAYYQPLAFDPRLLQRLGKCQRDYPLTFVGGLSPSHRERWEFLAALSNSVPIHFWGYGTEALAQHGLKANRLHGDAWGMDMFSVLARSAITVNHHIDVAKSNANNMRLFEATGCGALLVTDYKENLGDLFAIGSEVVAYRSVTECTDLISYYMERQDEARAIAQRGQARTLRDHTYEARMRHTAELLDRHLEIKIGTHRLPDPDLNHISYGRTEIEPGQITTELLQSWRSDLIPLRQRALVQRELQDMYRGTSPVVFHVLADALRPYVRPHSELLEIGCASGYYYEVLEYLLQTRLSYRGIDFSDAMIRLARGYYPHAQFEVGDGGALRFQERSIPIVISSCVLLHVPAYALHIAEAARVASEIVVFHRTPVARRTKTRHFKKFAYGVETCELRFSEVELFERCREAGLELVSQYDFNSHVERDEFETTYVFRAGL
ncbi:MAG: glycosyltransferase [Nitrospira sp.]